MSAVKRKTIGSWMAVVGRTMRAAAIGGLALGACALLAGIILWDADFYAARDRWEHMKNAWFGRWPENNRLRPLRGEDSVVCHWGYSGSIGICFRKKANDSEADGGVDVD